MVKLTRQQRSFEPEESGTLLKPLEPGAGTNRDHERVDVLVSPSAGRSDEEVLRNLSAIGADQVDHLATGFISARITRGEIAGLERIARVSVKMPLQPKSR